MKKIIPWTRSAAEKAPDTHKPNSGPTTNAVSTDPISPRLRALTAELELLMPGRAEQLLSQLCTGLKLDAQEDQRYRAAEIAAGTIYPKFKFSEYGRLFLEDESFLNYYRRFMDPDNWHSLDRKYTLAQILKLAARLDGDMAECGTYKGASAFLLCQVLKGTDKRVHLFDSFQGLSAPGKWDGGYWVPGALSAPENELRQSLTEFDNYRVYRGWIPQRFREVEKLNFSLVHIDVDLYQPTRDSLEFFYPRIVSRGIILMDDYGFSTCPGAKRAADEFFADKAEPILMLTTGQALVIRR